MELADMNDMVRIVIIPLVVCIALYLLYINGYMVTQVKRAVLYVESMKGRKASFSCCTGYTRRIVKFKESKTYRFTFAPELTKGEVSVELLDSEKNIILRLDAKAPRADICLNVKSRYYLVFRFAAATGEYVLNWN